MRVTFLPKHSPSTAAENAPRRGSVYQRYLVIMVKEPVAGRVKTRLAREVGTVAAARFYRLTVHGLLQRLARDRRWRTLLAVTPDSAVASRHWPLRIRRTGQGHGDLGARIQRLMDGLPPGPVVIIGSDIPGIEAADIARAFAALGRYPTVFGPSPDGGYWLVGFRRTLRIPRPFRAVVWSQGDTLAATTANLGGLPIARVRVLADVDTAADLARAGPWYGGVIRSPARAVGSPKDTPA